MKDLFQQFYKLKEPTAALIQKTTKDFMLVSDEANRTLKHSLYLFNIPAPTHKERLSSHLNNAVADVISTFNRNLEHDAKLCDIKIIDVHKLTADPNGFSNQIHHIDDWHLGPSLCLRLRNN